MSSSSTHPNVSFSSFQDLFDAALREYSQKTGKDITTDPITARLRHCDTSDAVIGILQEQAHAFDQYRNGDWKVQLMRRLKPTVDILIRLSTGGVLGEGIGLVSINQINAAFSGCSRFNPQRFPPAKAIFAGVGLLLAVCISFSPQLCLRF